MSEQQATEIVRLSVVNTELRSRVERLETDTLAADLEALRAKAADLSEIVGPLVREDEDDPIELLFLELTEVQRVEWWDVIEQHRESVTRMRVARTALRAELDKPSGASLTAEMEEEIEDLHDGGQVVADQLTRQATIADAWKALAKARAAFNIAGDVTALDVASRDVSKARAALRALDIDPEAT